MELRLSDLQRFIHGELEVYNEETGITSCGEIENITCDNNVVYIQTIFVVKKNTEEYLTLSTAEYNYISLANIYFKKLSPTSLMINLKYQNIIYKFIELNST